jgi:hypothetical protein
MERDIQLRTQASITSMKNEAEAARKKGIVDKYGQLVKARMRPGTDKDVKRVTHRLKTASAYYRPDTMAGPITKCFEAKELGKYYHLYSHDSLTKRHASYVCD